MAKESAAKRERFPPSLQHEYVKPRARKRCLGALVTNYVLRSWACGRTLLQLWRACDPAAPLSLPRRLAVGRPSGGGPRPPSSLPARRAARLPGPPVHHLSLSLSLLTVGVWPRRIRVFVVGGLTGSSKAENMARFTTRRWKERSEGILAGQKYGLRSPL